MGILDVALVAFLAGSVFAVLPGEAAYYAGKEFERLGQYREAEGAYLECVNDQGPLGVYAAARAGIVRARAGDHKGGLERLTALLGQHPDGPWAGMIAFEIASLHAHQQRYEDASAYFMRALETDANVWWLDRYRKIAAENFIRNPATHDLGMAYYRNVVETTGFIRPRLDAAGVLAQSPNPFDRLMAIEGLLKSRENGDAVRVFQRIPAEVRQDPELLIPWKQMSGRMKMVQGQLDSGLAELKAFALEHPDSSWAPAGLLFAARTLISHRRLNAAEEIADQLVSSYPVSDEMGEALFRLAQYYASAKQPELAVIHANRLIGVLPVHERAGSALLAVGHAYRDAGDQRNAVDIYDRILADYPHGVEAPEAADTAGHLLRKAGRAEAAASRFEQGAQLGLGTYYGHRAQEHLAEIREDVRSLPAPFRADGRRPFVRPVPQDAEPHLDGLDLLGEDERIQRLRFFGAHGYDEAEWEALHLAEELDAHGNPEPFYVAMGEAGVAYTAMQLANARNWGVLENGAPSVSRMRIRFPRAYWGQVVQLSRETGVDPYLILAVARQESTYRPALTSHAGARGIMQVMPSTGQWLAQVEPAIEKRHADHPDDPGNCLRMGAYYLMRMIERSGGNLVYALASYNGGPGNCDKWRRRFGEIDMADFIEKIPFSETKDYVKRVLGFYAAYHSLYPTFSE